MAATVQRQSLTRWSRHDPVLQCHGNADHWAKLRVRAEHRAVGMVTKDPTFHVVERKLPKIQDGDGRADPVANAIASRVAVRDLHGNVSGNYASPHYSSGSSSCRSSRSRHSLSSSFNERAKQGFEYWHKERPKPTKFGRYGIGSYKTLLGLGSAPRT